MEPITISIVLASFARADLLELSILSILNQVISYPYNFVIVNDGFENDGTKEVCEKYGTQVPITYIFTGHRNIDKLLPRNPAVPNNIAIKQASGNIVILTCPEILHFENSVNNIVKPVVRNKKAISIPSLIYFDNTGKYTQALKNKTRGALQWLSGHKDHVKMPFFMGVWKQELLKIGGYDEDFTGYAFEDNDLVGRLLANGCFYHKTPVKIIHLYHGKRCQEGTMEYLPAWNYNKRLLEERKGIIVRNKQKSWGELNNSNIVMDKSMHNIPKILHLYWENRPMSWLQMQTVVTFHRWNPEWEICIYVPIQKDVSTVQYIPDYTGIDYFPKVRKLDYVSIIPVDVTKYGISDKLHNILRSDIFRYKVLYEAGGVWSDFDILWLKPMERIFQVEGTLGNPIQEMQASVCRFNTMDQHHNISVLLAQPNHPVYEYLITQCDKIQKRYTGREVELHHQHFGTDLWDKTWPTFADMASQFKGLVAFPYKTFYPYSIFHLEDLYEERKVINVMDSNVLCIHWFNGHKLSKQFINTKSDADCSMSRILYLIKNGIL